MLARFARFAHSVRFARFALAVALALTAAPARADEWLTFRHDPQRTGASSGRVIIDRPTVAWRRYLGGQLDGSQYVVADVDNDRVREVVYVTGGRAVAKRPDNVILWESPLLGLSTLVGLTDLDEDGTPEVLGMASLGRVYLLSGRDGSVLWQNPAGPIGEVAAARVADLDGDGRSDLYIGECRCCTLRGSAIGVAYSFAGGFAAARQMWTLDPSAAGCGAASDQIADVDGDGALEVVVNTRGSEMVILSGQTGAARWRVPAPASGGFYPNSAVYPVNLDADPARELVVVTNGYLATGDLGARRIAMWDHTGGPAGFTMRWEVAAPDRVNDTVTSSRDAIGDLDGDGTPEVAFGITAAGVSRVEVRNAVTGAMRATRAMAEFVGAADLDGDGRAEVLVREATALAAYRLERAGALTRLWSLPQRSLVNQFDHALWLSDANPTRPLALNLDADPALELVVRANDATGGAATLVALDTDRDPPTEIARFTAAPGLTILTNVATSDLTQPGPQLVTATSDGYLIVLDRMMRPTNRFDDGEIVLPGMRIGGYYSGAAGLGPTPTIARLGDPAVLVRDSRPALLRLDATRASLTQGPRDVWERLGARWPVVYDADGDGARDVAMVEGRDVVAVDAMTGRAERFRARDAVPSQGIYADLLPARRNSGTDLYFSGALPGAVMQAIALDGRTGMTRWSGFTRALMWGYMLFSAADLDGDGVDEFVTVTNSALAINGATGTVANDNGTFVAYANPMVLDADADGALDVWVHGGYFADRLLSRTMATRATRADRTAPNSGAWGARVSCGGAATVVSGAYDAPDLWATRVRDATPIAQRVLVGGEVYAPGMVPAGRRPGSIGNVTAVAGLSPDGGPAVLVGSTDGFLYALDACTLARIWSLDLRYPVGEPVVGDVDGDGADDLLVTCADGFLYRVGRAAFDAPMQVLDLDPDGMSPDDDVDAIDAVETLHARWTAVPGATSYEVGVFAAGGSEARFPNYRNVGNVTRATLSMLPLRQGQRYYVAVRPVGPAGPGLEARSDGVVISDTMGPAARAEVAPQRAWPLNNVPPVVTASCRDRIGLLRMRVEIVSDPDRVVRVLDMREMPGASREVRATWDGRDAMGAMSAQGDYRARVTCVDLRMREQTAEARFALDPAARPQEPPPDASADAGAIPVHDGASDSGRRERMPAGCACRIEQIGLAGSGRAAGGRRVGWIAALAALAALGARRKR